MDTRYSYQSGDTGHFIERANRFRYNKFGVCTNPEVVYNYSDPKERIHSRYTEITLCRKGKKWSYGYHYGYSTGCGSGPAGCCFDYDSRNEAINHIALFILDQYKEDGKRSYLRYNHLKNWLADQRQLSLF